MEAKRYFSQSSTKVSSYDLATQRRVMEVEEPSVAPRAPGAGSDSDGNVEFEAVPLDQLNPGIAVNQVEIRDRMMVGPPTCHHLLS